MKIKKIIIVLLILITLVGCKKRHDDNIPIGNPNETYHSFYDGSFGTSGKLEGNSIIISIFVKDKTTSWTDSKADKKSIQAILDKLSTATVYLQKNAAKYGENITFAYDWEKYKDLKYDATFKENIITEGGEYYKLQTEWIKNNINSKALKNKYKADNIIYLFYINTAFSNEVHPWTMTHNTCDTCTIEFTNIYYRYERIASPAGTFAHEILHQFGVPDLYVSSRYIPQTYVDHLTKNDSQDIMYFISQGSSIASKFSDLDAYYAGIGPKPSVVKEWNLGVSEFERAK